MDRQEEFATGGASILVVEDEPGLARLIEQLLRAEGHRVVFAGTGGEAIACLRQCPIALMILDYSLPDMTGSGLLEQAEPPPPFIVITGAGDERIAVEMMKRGARDYLVKDDHLIDILPVVVGNVLRHIESGRRVEEQLRASQQRYRGLVEFSPTAVLINRNNRIVFANRTAVELFGVEREDQILGKSPFDLFHQECHAAVAGRIEQLRRGSSVPLLEEKIVRMDGTIRDVEVAASPFVDRDGLAIQVVMHDITDARRAEEERARMEDRLRRVQKLDALGRMAAQVAHDFNNLLTIIRGQAELARASVGDLHEAAAPLLGVEQAAEEAATITRSLLTFSRSLPGEKQRVRLSAILDEITPLIRHSLPPQIRLEVETDPACNCLVLADTVQMHQVLLNLAVNARDAMPRGGTLRITVAGSRADEGAGAAGPEPSGVRLIVADTGTGMSAEVRSRLFEPFFTTKPPGIGTGLGLSIIHGVVIGHGGQIDVESRPGAGTTFTISLPVVDPGPMVEAGRPPGAVALVVRDDLVRPLLVQTFQAAGWSVLEATGPADAIARLQASGSVRGLVIVDADGPEPGGRDVYLAIRRARGDLPVLLIGSEADPRMVNGDPRACVLRRPFRLLELAEVADRLVFDRPTGEEG